MKGREKLLKSLALGKTYLATKKAEEEKALKQGQELASEISKSINNNLKGEKSMKKFSKQLKHDLAILKAMAQCDAAADRRQVDPAEFSAMVKEYAELKEEKAIDLTSDHANLLREIQSSDMIFSFDEKSEAGQILALFSRYDMPVLGKVKIPVDNQAVELEHVGETDAVVEQTTSESLLTLEVTRAAMTFKLSRTLQFKSIVDRMKYVESLITLAVEKGMVEGIINGQGANSAQQDSGYGAKKMGKKFPGLRAILSANSYTKDMANAALTGDAGRTAMQGLFDAAGARFSRSQSGYVILAARKERLLISDLKKGAGVTGVNTGASSQVYENDYQGVPVIQVDWLKNRAASGSGYSETGFVSSTAADNDHGVLILIDSKQMWYALEGERLDVEYKPSTDSFEITLNCQAGWAMLCDAKNQPGVLGVNIGADV